MDLEDLGLRLLLAGMGLGIALMTFVVSFDSTAFYQNDVAPTMLGAMRPLGYVLDAAVLLSFAMAIGGMACFAGRPSTVPAAAPDRAISAAERLEAIRRQRRERPGRAGLARRRRTPTPSQGST